MAILGSVPWSCSFYCYWHRHRDSRSIYFSCRVSLCSPDFTEANLEQWSFRIHCLLLATVKLNSTGSQSKEITPLMLSKFLLPELKEQTAWIHQKDEDDNERKHWGTRAGVRGTSQKWSWRFWQAGTRPECESQKVDMYKRQKVQWKESWIRVSDRTEGN